ncbi:MAG: ferredoxin [Caulobacter sp.]|nr:ferredoxin [Caulobacter sp.]
MSSEATPHRVIADRSACCGYGTCVEICPEIYRLEGGLVVLTTDIVPAELLARAIEGAESCPQGALVVEAVAG